MKINAHIPTQQYGFIELTDLPDDPQSVQEAYNRYAEVPISLTKGNRKLVECFVGGSIYYDDVAHSYTNEAGEVYLSGSVFAHQGEKPFDAQSISAKMATKSGVPQADILDMWKMGGDISREFGTTLHKAMELYGKHRVASEKLEKEYHLPNHPVLREAVLSFYALHKEEAEYEPMIVDHDKKHAGQIDRLVIISPPMVSIAGVCRIEDYKTDGDITKKLESYWKQLRFYSQIMEADGWKVESPVIHHWAGEWKIIKEEKK